MIEKTKKLTNTMPFMTAAMNIRMDMAVLSNVSIVSNTTDGRRTLTMKNWNGKTSARVVRSDRNGK